jgi:hypothetical protein
MYWSIILPYFLQYLSKCKYLIKVDMLLFWYNLQWWPPVSAIKSSVNCSWRILDTILCHVDTWEVPWKITATRCLPPVSLIHTIIYFSSISVILPYSRHAVNLQISECYVLLPLWITSAGAELIPEIYGFPIFQWKFRFQSSLIQALMVQQYVFHAL